MQKILPRIQGSSQVIKNVIIKLFELAADVNNVNEIQDKPPEIFDKKQGENLEESYQEMIYPRSAEKLVLMWQRMSQDGFTSYWL